MNRERYRRWLLRAVLRYFGRCPDATRLRWGRMLGRIMPAVLRSRTHVVRTNLALCFPQETAEAREALLRRHFHLLTQSYIDRGLLWFGSRERIMETLTLEGEEHLLRPMEEGRRVIMLSPHFVGLDAAGTQLSLILEQAGGFYTGQPDPVVEELMTQGRSRFNRIELVSRGSGIRGMIRLLDQRIPVYYLPDMDFGRKGAAFIPFFGVPAATLLTTARIAAAWDVAVVPIMSRLDPETGRYAITILPALTDFPGTDTLDAAMVRVNRLIEDWARPDPAQYYWVHRRFKTRPPGQPKVY